jgi:hypothetical protein
MHMKRPVLTCIGQLGPNGINDPTFMQIPNRKLFALIRQAIAPASPQKFGDIFVQGLKFIVIENFQLSAVTFRERCSMFKVYFREVKQRFDFLAENLPKEIIPDLMDHDTGLVNLVLQRMVPFEVPNIYMTRFTHNLSVLINGSQ